MSREFWCSACPGERLGNGPTTGEQLPRPMMRSVSRYLALVVAVLAILVSTVPVAGDKSWPISSPRGGKIKNG